MITELAPAKVNLFLHVVGRRGDGYHLLESLVVFASIGDRITVAPSPDMELTVSGRFADAIQGDPDQNLVIRAARALQAATGTTKGATVHLEKNLPVAAGIGGGSADAAATLIALNRMWEAGLADEALARIGLTLGADVPACLVRRPIMMRGIGEILEPALVPDAPGIVLVNPMKPLPTPAVFADFRTGEPFADAGSFDPALHDDQSDWIARLLRTSNSLEPPARRLLPVISRVIDALSGAENCLLARMSGSGATCFGLFPDWATAARRAQDLSEAHPDWWVAPGTLVT